MLTASLFAHHFFNTVPPPPLPGDLQPRDGVALVALSLALVAFVTTVRTWLTKAMLDAEDGIHKESAAAANAEDDDAKKWLELHVANLRARWNRTRWNRIDRQLWCLRGADFLAILAGLVALTFPFRPWLPFINWTGIPSTWNPKVFGYQLFLVAVIAIF